MKRRAVLTFIVRLFALALASPAHATPYDARTVLVNVSVGGNAGGFSNVIGVADITRQSVPLGPGNPLDEATASASTVGFYSSFVFTPTLITNLGRASATVNTINKDGGPTGAGGGAVAKFRLFVEVIAASGLPLSVLSAVPVDVGWRVEGTRTSG